MAIGAAARAGPLEKKIAAQAAHKIAAKTRHAPVLFF